MCINLEIALSPSTRFF